MASRFKEILRGALSAGVLVAALVLVDTTTGTANGSIACDRADRARPARYRTGHPPRLDSTYASLALQRPWAPNASPCGHLHDCDRDHAVSTPPPDLPGVRAGRARRRPLLRGMRRAAHAGPRRRLGDHRDFDDSLAGGSRPRPWCTPSQRDAMPDRPAWATRCSLSCATACRRRPVCSRRVRPRRGCGCRRSSPRPRRSPSPTASPPCATRLRPRSTQSPRLP